jgi:hypothetical protein
VLLERQSRLNSQEIFASFFQKEALPSPAGGPKSNTATRLAGLCVALAARQ